MKKDIKNNDELLKKLVLSGDTLAFFALTEPYFKGRYLRVRSGGTTQQDAHKMLLDEAVELLGTVQHVSSKHFNAWLEEHCSLLPVSEQADATAGQIDKKLLAETEDFLNHCSRVLLRTGSDIKRTANFHKNKFPQAVLRHKGVFWMLIVIAIAGVGTGTTLLMVKTQVALQVHFLSSGKRSFFQFPPAAWVSSDSIGAVVAPVLTIEKDTSGARDSLPASAQKNTSHDTLLPKKKPAEKAADPVVTGAAPARRTLPPVVPKARLILPPPPPPPVDPVYPAYQETTAPEQQTVPPPSDPSPPPESESPY